MKWFLNLSTRIKLFLGFGIMVILLAVVITVSYQSITSIQASQKKIFEEDLSISASMKDIRYYNANIRAISLDAIVASSLESKKSILEKGNRYEKMNDSLVQKLLELGKKTPEFLPKLQEFNSIRTVFKETRNKEVIPRIFAGKIDEAKKIITGIQMERNKKIETIIDELTNIAERNAETTVLQAGLQINRAVFIFSTIALAALLLSSAMVILLGRTIANPLKEISGISERVASGDLSMKIGSDIRRDEVGSLTKNFDKMINNLRNVTKEILKSVNILTTSASEILATTTQVASSATETASSVSETTTTVEEVKQTAQVATQKAKYVSESSQKAVQVSQVGKKSVEETINMMNKIREQMESVAESIVKLSEQSQSIGEIISTVNDLAGVKQTLEAGESIRILTDSISEAAQAATQIAASSQQQSVGMDQVAQAMENIKQASTQNVSGTRQAESAAKNLHDLGSKLKGLVEQYRV
ncbi:MAG: methyl-accepting chemotaxis protein [Ignavibacteriales bacterium]|nr:methyl-accepting chemotaxis protein [Ignavibacteriales bacterium]